MLAKKLLKFLFEVEASCDGGIWVFVDVLGLFSEVSGLLLSVEVLGRFSEVPELTSTPVNIDAFLFNVGSDKAT